MKRRVLIWGGLVVAMALVVVVMFRIAGEQEAAEPAEVNDPTENGIEILQVRENDWTKGNPKAKVTVVKYSDFSCPACRSFAAVDNQLAKELGNHVFFVYRHFPINNSDMSKMIARHAEAAGRQGKFWEMHDLIFINQQLLATNNQRRILQQFAEKLKLDLEQFNMDLSDPEIAKKVQADYESGRELGIRSVPAIFINGEKIRNPGSVDAYRALIEAQIE